MTGCVGVGVCVEMCACVGVWVSVSGDIFFSSVGLLLQHAFCKHLFNNYAMFCKELTEWVYKKLLLKIAL